MSEVKCAISILKEKLANAGWHNLAYQRLSVAEMQEIWVTLEKSDKDYANLKEQFNFKQNLTEQVAALQKQRDALAAENAALKLISNDRRSFIMNGVQLGYIKVPTVETDPALETIRIAVSPQEPTPATDAYLNSVRAEGADAVARRLRRAIPLFKTIHAGAVGECSDIAEILSAQLRAGEPS